MTTTKTTIIAYKVRICSQSKDRESTTLVHQHTIEIPKITQQPHSAANCVYNRSSRHVARGSMRSRRMTTLRAERHSETVQWTPAQNRVRTFSELSFKLQLSLTIDKNNSIWIPRNKNPEQATQRHSTPWTRVMKITTWNVWQYHLRKWDIIYDLIANCDLLCLTETWTAVPPKKDWETLNSNYSHSHTEGGVAIITQPLLPFRVRRKEATRQIQFIVGTMCHTPIAAANVL